MPKDKQQSKQNFESLLVDLDDKTEHTIDPFGVTMNSNFAPSLYEAPTTKPLGLNFEKILK